MPTVAKQETQRGDTRTVWVTSPALWLEWKYPFIAHWVYSELEVGPPGQDPIRSSEYWCTIVHRRGYMGYQSRHVHSESRVLCSIWDLGDREDGHVPKYTVMEYCGDGVTCKLFDSEGTGYQAFLDLKNIQPKAGYQFRSIVRFEPYFVSSEQESDPKKQGQRLRSQCWFQLDEFNNGNWFHIATYDGPDFEEEHSKYKGHTGMKPGAFLEQFKWIHLDDISKPARGIYRMWAKSGAENFGSLSEDWVHLSEAKVSNICELAKRKTAGLHSIDFGVTTDKNKVKGHYLSHCGCTLKRTKESDVHGMYTDNNGSDQECERESHERCPVRLSINPYEDSELCQDWRKIPKLNSDTDAHGLMRFHDEIGFNFSKI